MTGGRLPAPLRDVSFVVPNPVLYFCLLTSNIHITHEMLRNSLMPDWDSIFADRGRVFTGPHSEIDKVVKLIKDKSGSRILELGCGSGRHVIHLAKLGFDVYGFDASPKAIRMTQDWLDEESLNAHLCQHRMEEPFPYDDNFFDAVISTQVIHHNLITNIRKTILEIERVLRPDGVLFVTFPILRASPASKDDGWKLKEVEKGTYIPQSGWESGIPHHYFTEDEIPYEFQSFEIQEVYLDETGHRCVIAKLHLD
ncbi:MAG: class I SAM-dependent methyltransferase [Candidatus Thorarchaeota archaeon]|nr:class I SAM-dependent methyltransferase [Candidatus Thorarchaeota archaeon]